MVKMTEYASRRKHLMQQIGSNSVVVLPAAPEVIRNGDAHYPFRQNSDFYYLTGFNEPEAVLVLLPNRGEGEYVLFNRVRDRDREIWDGPRAGQEGARQDYLADQAFPIDTLKEHLPELLTGRDAIHYPLGSQRAFDNLLLDAVKQIRSKIRSGMQSPVSFEDVSPTIHEMRLKKSKDELALMQRAVDITARGHVAAIQACRPNCYEYELEAALSYEFQKGGARQAAYSSIVGAGKNSCILHYVANNEKAQDGDVVLIDAGAEFELYAADITRTFPANGKFTAEQREIYDLVLRSQLAGIAAIKPGALWTAAQEAITKVITEGLVDLGLLKGNVDDLLEQKAYLPFYMHNSGHWLGLDVHDVGRYKVDDEWRKYEEGHVLTVEPGIYISADIPDVPKRWHNIGVRIEDDVAVTKKGCHVLSQEIPKEIAEIEALVGNLDSVC